MTIQFRPAKRENVPLLVGVAGGTGSGKTMSALLLARGMAAGQPFAIIDTENGRAKHYADLFPEMRHAEIRAPFRPGKYADAIEAGAREFPVVVVDSASHEWAGDGGCLDWHDDIAKGDPAKNMSAWIEPKREHKRMVTRLLQVGAHVILCFRAEPKVEAVRDGKGKLQIVPKASLVGLDGWLPITEKMLPYELTCSFLLMADRPGVPRPIKLEEQHKPFVPLDEPLSAETGRLLAEWAKGSGGEPSAVQADAATDASHEPPVAEADQLGDEPPSPPENDLDFLTFRLVELAPAESVEKVRAAIVANRDARSATQHAKWLREQIRRAEERQAQGSFADRIPEGAKGAS